jgi:benzil reductase ((S)-benzoin forming)
MFKFYITGANKGLGKSIISKLELNDTCCIIGRTKNQSNPKIKFKKIDLSSLNEVSKFEFGIKKNNFLNVLINNAAIIGEIDNFQNLDPENIIETFNVNLISPLILANKFLCENINCNNDTLIVNITSGIYSLKPSKLSLYAISKHALSSITSQLSAEFNDQKLNASIISIDPGVMNTEMNNTLMSVNHSLSDFFKAKLANSSYNSSDIVSTKIVTFVKSEKWINGNHYHINNI